MPQHYKYPKEGLWLYGASERRDYFFDANFQSKVIADWESTSTPSHLHHGAQRLWGGRWGGRRECLIRAPSLWALPVALTFDLRCRQKRWRRIEVRPGEGREKEGVASLAGDWECSSAWRQTVKPAALLWPLLVHQSLMDTSAQGITGCGWTGGMRGGNGCLTQFRHLLST